MKFGGNVGNMLLEVHQKFQNKIRPLGTVFYFYRFPPFRSENHIKKSPCAYVMKLCGNVRDMILDVQKKIQTKIQPQGTFSYFYRFSRFRPKKKFILNPSLAGS